MKLKIASLVIGGTILVVVFMLTSGSNSSLRPSPNLAQVVDTTPPTTSITSPTDGQIISGNFTTCATATDNIGVTSIVLHMGGIPASGTTSPFCAGWNTVNFANGFYSVFSTATDAAGNTGTSVSILAGVANNLTTPIVKATMPAASAVVSGQVTLGAKAYSPAGTNRVDFLIDGTSTVVASATAPSALNTYTASWNSTAVVNGSHNIIAKVYDINGLSAVSGVTFTVTNTGADVTPPTISAITSSGITSSGATVSWTTNEISDTQVLYGTTSSYGLATTLDTALVTAHTATLSGLTSSTIYHYAVRSRDAAGNLSTSTDQTFTTGAFVDTIAPTVSIAAPVVGATVSSTVLISTVASDNVAVDHVDFYAGNSLIGADATNPFAISWDTTTIVNGSYPLTARAYDAAGNNTTSTQVIVTVNNIVVPPPDTILPDVSMTAPLPGSSVSGSTVTLSATASDNIGVTRVEFYRGTTLISTDTTGSPDYSIVWNTTGVQKGTYSLKAKAFDAAGNSKTSASVSVTVVDITPPTVTIINPTGNTIPSSGTVTVKTTATDLSSIQYIKIYIDGVLKKQCNTIGTCNYNWSVTNIATGNHTITVTAQDKAPIANTMTVTKVVTK